MPNVSNNVYQAITQATKSNRDINQQELTNIKSEMDKDQSTPAADKQAVLTALERGSSFTITSGTQSATISPKEVSFPTKSDPAKEGAQMVDGATDVGMVYNTIDKDQLGKNLANSLKARLNSAPAVEAALKQVNSSAAVLSMVNNLSDDDLKRLSQNKEGKELLKYAYKDLGSWRTNSEQGKAMQRIVAAASETHGKLAGVEFNVPKAVEAELKAKGATLQKMSDGSTLRAPNYDNYETTVKLPNDAAAKALFEKFAKKPNNVGDNYFDAMNDFTLRGGGGTALPKVGDIYDIDISGPDNGSVMVVGADPITDKGGSITVATITEAKYGEHPENGTRQFGFRKNDDGTYTFYTRGASRGINSATQTAGAYPQQTSWRGLIDGFENEAKAAGGSVVKARSQTNTDTPF